MIETVTNESSYFSESLANEFGADFKMTHRKDIYLVNRENPFNLLKDLKNLKNNYSFIVLLDIYVSRCLSESCLELTYVLLSLERHERLLYRLKVSKNERCRSVKNLWPCAESFESNLIVEYGLEIKQAKKTTHHYLDVNGKEVFPLVKDLKQKFSSLSLNQKEDSLFEDISSVEDHRDDERSWVEGGLFEKTLGGFYCSFELDGQEVCRTSLNPRNYDRFLDKIFQKTSIEQTPFYALQSAENLGLSTSLLTIKGIEEIYNIKASDRSLVLRMIFLELERIYEHIVYFSRLCQKLEAYSALEGFFSARQVIDQLLEKLELNPLCPQLIKVGSEVKGFSKSWVFHIQQALKKIEKMMTHWNSNLTRNRFFTDRLKAGKVSALTAIEMGISGPNLRACGVNYDLRKVSPYYFYEEVDFEVPLGISGLSYDRYLVRVEEVFQSIGIVFQLIDNIPTLENGNGQKDLEEEALSLSSFQSPTYLETYQFIENHQGELGLSLGKVISDSKTFDYFKLRTSNLVLPSLIEKVVEGEEFEGALMTMVSFYPSALERFR